MKALDGILVLSLEQAVAAPLASCRLADAGARVIKIERADGDFARGYDRAANGISSYFAWLNRGKESIALDLRDATDKALLHRILERADVFIQNFAVGAADRAGFGAEALRARHPRLVTCDISGYGEHGPYSDMKAYDLLVQAESGLVSISGAPGPHGRVGVSVCDIATGLNAAIGIQQALLRRVHTGHGDAVKVSLFDSMADWMTVPLLHYNSCGEPPQRLGLAHPTIAPYGEFITADGSSVLLCVQNEREWRDLVEGVLLREAWLDDERYANNLARVANRSFVDASIQAVIGTLPRAELERRLRAARIAFGTVNDMAGLAQHPQLRTIKLATECGSVAIPAPPVRSAESGEYGAVPALDQHGAAIRAEFSRLGS